MSIKSIYDKFGNWIYNNPVISFILWIIMMTIIILITLSIFGLIVAPGIIMSFFPPTAPIGGAWTISSFILGVNSLVVPVIAILMQLYILIWFTYINKFTEAHKETISKL